MTSDVSDASHALCSLRSEHYLKVLCGFAPVFYSIIFERLQIISLIVSFLRRPAGFQALHHGRLFADSSLKFSKRSAQAHRTRIFLNVRRRESWTVPDIVAQLYVGVNTVLVVLAARQRLLWPGPLGAAIRADRRCWAVVAWFVVSFHRHHDKRAIRNPHPRHRRFGLRRPRALVEGLSPPGPPSVRGRAMRQPADACSRARSRWSAVSDLTRPSRMARAAQSHRCSGASRRTLRMPGRDIAEEAYDRVNRLATAELAAAASAGRHPPSGVRIIHPRSERTVLHRPRCCKTEQRGNRTDAYGRSNYPPNFTSPAAAGGAAHHPSASAFIPKQATAVKGNLARLLADIPRTP